MNTPTMQSILPRELIGPLKKLGRTEWLEIVTNADHHTFVVHDSVCDTLADDPDFLDTLLQADGSLLLQLLAYSKLLANGPKVVQPTCEQCEALAHVDLSLRFCEYEQPFPVFLVEVPAGIQQQFTEEYSFPCPRFVIPFHLRPENFLAVLCARSGNDDSGGVFTVFSRNVFDETMEDTMRVVKTCDGPDYQQGAVLERIALNLSLLLTRYGFRDDGPINPKAFQKQTKLANSKSKRKRERAQRLLDAAINRVEFNQDVQFFNKISMTEDSGESTGMLKSPHWRRGHYRRARVGIGRTDSRLVFVRPSFINSQHFDGDRADTQYRIRTDKVEITTAG